MKSQHSDGMLHNASVGRGKACSMKRTSRPMSAKTFVNRVRHAAAAALSTPYMRNDVTNDETGAPIDLYEYELQKCRSRVRRPESGAGALNTTRLAANSYDS